jgi:hypothetical protein
MSEDQPKPFRSTDRLLTIFGEELVTADIVFLDDSQLMDGDIILMRGNEKFSKKISKWDGKYSHAAIKVPPFGLFDADIPDLSTTHLHIDRWELHETGVDERGNKTYKSRMLCALPGVTEAAVLRHRKINTKNPTWLFCRLRAAVLKYIGLEYPHKAELVDAAQDIPDEIKPSVKALLEEIEPKKPTVPGPFCSQLVALIFQEIRLGLFDPEIAPNKVSPNLFLNCPNFEDRSKEVVCRADPTALLMDDPERPDTKFGARLGGKRRTDAKAWTERRREFARLGIEWERFVTDLSSTVPEMRDETA